MLNIKPIVIPLVAALSVWGCSPDAPTGKTALENFPGELTQAEYDALSDGQKYLVSNKLMSSMFKGIPVGEFFDVSRGMEKLSLSSVGRNLLSDTKSALSTELSQEEQALHDMVIMGFDDIGGDRSISSKFTIFDDSQNLIDDWPKHQPMARIMQFPLSKQMFDNFVAYTLVNTILFSPAEEIDSTTVRDVQKVFNKLYDDLRDNKSVQQIIARHQRTQENWRRFRSPEDNTREMIEIYLGLFDRDADVPRASIACKDLYLTDASDDYELLSTGFPNTQPQYVLDTFVTTCGDFYDLVANHPLVIPRVTTVLVEYFFYTKTAEERAGIVETIISAEPTTFQEIVKSIVFSKEYLLNNERPKSFEENFFGAVHQLKWRPHLRVLSDMTLSPESNSNQVLSLTNMSWPTMSLKLGRFSGVPLDALSFANYHRALREAILVDGQDGGDGTCRDINSNDLNMNSSECNWREGLGLIEPEEPVHPDKRRDEDTNSLLTSKPLPEELAKYELDKAEYDTRKALFHDVYQLSVNELYDYLFMSAIQRKATDLEKNSLTAMIREHKPFYIREDDNQDLYVYFDETNDRRERRTNYDEVAKIVFDYLSRLPETYYFKKIN